MIVLDVNLLLSALRTTDRDFPLFPDLRTLNPLEAT